MTTDLDAADLAVLERLRETEDSTTGGDARAATEADSSAEMDEADKTAKTDESRLSDLEENGLVAETDDGYELTASGRRLLRTGNDHSASRPDVPPAVEQSLASADLRPDVEDALARAVTFLRRWGSATANEIIDAAYSETDAEYDDGEEWWDELVRERFASLPGVVPPSEGDDEWRYDGESVPTDSDDAVGGGDDEPRDDAPDGRQVLDEEGDYGSARRALEREARDDAEEAALSAAFERLADADAEAATTDELARAAAAETDSDVDADRLAAVLESVPKATRDGDRWRYEGDERYWDEGATSGEEDEGEAGDEGSAGRGSTGE